MCDRSFMHTNGENRELVKIIISFAFIDIYINKTDILAKGIGAKIFNAWEALMNNGGMQGARLYDQSLMKSRNYSREPNPLGWNPSFLSEGLQQIFNSFNITFFKTTLISSPVVNEIWGIFWSPNASRMCTSTIDMDEWFHTATVKFQKE